MKILAVEIDKLETKDSDYLPHLRDEALKVLEFYENDFIREL